MAEAKVIGLSGGIGSGKSTVAAILARLGATVIDADAIVHELQAAGQPLLREIADAFGEQLIGDDGSLDRDALAAIVFSDETARTRLGQIVHPAVGAEMARRLTAARASDARLIVLDIPLLFEGRRAGGADASALGYDATVLVWVPRKIQIERTVARDDCTAEEAERRIAAQMPIDEKRELADHIVDNSGSVEATEAAVRELYAELSGSEAAP